jgi:hypothetical protein
MIKVLTRNGVELFITLCDDCDENKGGYFCQVYLDEDCSEDYDYFVIHKEDLDCFENKDECIQISCEEYAKGFDDMPILNERFNKIYDLISDVDNMLDIFYMEHIFCNKNACNGDKVNMSELRDKMGSVKELAHFMAERYTWDN